MYVQSVESGHDLSPDVLSGLPSDSGPATAHGRGTSTTAKNTQEQRE